MTMAFICFKRAAPIKICKRMRPSVSFTDIALHMPGLHMTHK